MRVCFVAPYAHPVFDAAVPGRFGGSEVRTWLFSRALAQRPGWEVVVAVSGEGWPVGSTARDAQLKRRRIDGVDLVALRPPAAWRERLLGDVRAAVERHARFPWLRIAGWRARLLWQLPAAAALRAARPLEQAIYLRRFNNRSLWRTLEQIDADAYCTWGTHHVTSEVVAFCRRQRRKSVLLLESDANLSPDYFPGSRVRNRYGELGHVCHYGLAHADRIVAQTVRQQAIVRERFGREAVWINDPIDLDIVAPSPAPRRERFVLWVGKSEPIKRPEVCLELARRLPEVSFVMILNRAQPGLFDEVMSARPPNVRIVEQVPLAEMEAYFARAVVLVNTSDQEGLPVSFLQAGKYGVPVAALRVDPDGMLLVHRCGEAAGGDIERLCAAVRELWTDAQRAAEFGRTIRGYVESRHALPGRVAELAAVVEELIHS